MSQVSQVVSRQVVWLLAAWCQKDEKNKTVTKQFYSSNCIKGILTVLNHQILYGNWYLSDPNTHIHWVSVCCLLFAVCRFSLTTKCLSLCVYLTYQQPSDGSIIVFWWLHFFVFIKKFCLFFFPLFSYFFFYLQIKFFFFMLLLVFICSILFSRWHLT